MKDNVSIENDESNVKKIVQDIEILESKNNSLTEEQKKDLEELKKFKAVSEEYNEFKSNVDYDDQQNDIDYNDDVEDVETQDNDVNITFAEDDNISLEDVGDLF